MRKAEQHPNGDAPPFSNHYAVFPMLLWDLFSAPANLQIPSAPLHFHRKLECQVKCNGQWLQSDVVVWWCY